MQANLPPLPQRFHMVYGSSACSKRRHRASLTSASTPLGERAAAAAAAACTHSAGNRNAAGQNSRGYYYKFTLHPLLSPRPLFDVIFDINTPAPGGKVTHTPLPRYLTQPPSPLCSQLPSITAVIRHALFQSACVTSVRRGVRRSYSSDERLSERDFQLDPRR